MLPAPQLHPTLREVKVGSSIFKSPFFLHTQVEGRRWKPVTVMGVVPSPWWAVMARRGGAGGLGTHCWSCCRCGPFAQAQA